MKVGPREAQLREMREARAKAGRPNPFEDAARGRDSVRQSSDGGVESRHAGGGTTPSTSPQAGVAPGPSDSKSKRGRPRLSNPAKASRATRYRRQAEQRDKGDAK
jgi:hypothetical protein